MWLKISFFMFKQAGYLLSKAWASDSPVRNLGTLQNQTTTKAQNHTKQPCFGTKLHLLE